jgi:hypothetical protein
MSREVAGGCLCGNVRYLVTLPARFCAHCHCGNCRRAHGAAFVTYAGFREHQVRIDGTESLRRFVTDSGSIRSFCRQCGSTLFYEGPRWPGEIHVVVANIEGDIEKRPAAHVFVDHGADWWQINDDLPQFGGETGTEPKP